MSTNTITRPTTSTQRSQFAALTTDQRVTVRNAAIESGLAGKAAWEAGFSALTATKSSGVAGKTFQRAVGHRLVDLRAHSASCSCGKKHYKGEDIRDQHAAHKAAKVKVAA